MNSYERFCTEQLNKLAKQYDVSKLKPGQTAYPNDPKTVSKPKKSVNIEKALRDRAKAKAELDKKYPTKNKDKVKEGKETRFSKLKNEKSKGIYIDTSKKHKPSDMYIRTKNK